MSADNQELGEQRPDRGIGPVDFAFLKQQTFDDISLEHDVLQLFVTQARRVVPSLPGLAHQAQSDAAHLLKGSARGIGAWAAADVADRYEAAERAGRTGLYPALTVAFEQVEAAILVHLGAG